MIKIESVKISAKKKTDLKEVLIRKYGIRGEIKEFHILKKSLDARKKSDINFIYSIGLKLDDKEEKYLLKKYNNISELKEKTYKVPLSNSNDRSETVVVGMGPAGLFCAYVLSKAGFNVTIIDRGRKVEDRIEDVENFWENGILNTESNVQFGEGGAGTFSDGKLNTGIKDKEGRIDFILKTFVRFGAHEDILYDSKPHIGTDVLRIVIRNIRTYLEERGVKFLFSTKFVSFESKNGRVESVKVEDLDKGTEYSINCDNLVLAIGHSARDTFEYLNGRLNMTPKAFAMGFRVIHKQAFIDAAQYGENYPDLYEELEPSPYKLTYNSNERGVYSFCMCPGGYVVNASSESGRLCVNGMSDNKRDSGFANSAIIVQIKEDDLKKDDVFYGMNLQREVEENAYKTGNGLIPICTFKEFLEAFDHDTDFTFDEEFDCRDAFKGKFVKADLKNIFPDHIARSFIEGMLDFDKKIIGFAKSNPVIAAVEARSSSPVKILRNDTLQSNIKGIYPCGEGAGYAGGIISAAVDGIKCAEKIIEA
ncbi:MAG: NAD(P)/FAD-dependent oxidoreductase [Lachnospiraceae bacterium]|nr:NAD(P)/FAD-dependent oxidoreductase [Lachnospiraceae bacterium]